MTWAEVQRAAVSARLSDASPQLSSGLGHRVGVLLPKSSGRAPMMASVVSGCTDPERSNASATAF